MANANTATIPTPDKVAPIVPEKTVTVVINNLSGVDVCQLPHTRHPGPNPNASPRIQQGGVLVLLPGFNVVDTETLAVARKNPGYEARFHLKIERSPAVEYRDARVGLPFLQAFEVLPGRNPISGLPPARVLEYIPDMNEEQLREYIPLETRPDLRLAMMNRLEVLENPTDSPVLADV